MPIYEFYCERCNTIFSFFSRTVNTDKIPKCPNCKRTKLKRQMSVFAKVSGGKRDSDDAGTESGMSAIDEERMGKAMAMIADEAENINEEDPRQAANLMRKLSDVAGLGLGPQMEEALRRMEKGEDPERIEQEMGELLEQEEPFISGPSQKGKSRKKSRPKPRVDETLYDL